jgi:Na+/alanine symporter
VIAVAFVFLGSIFSNDLVWEMTDMFNNLMVIPNVLALAVLSGMVVARKKKKACCYCECTDAEKVAAEVAEDNE